MGKKLFSMALCLIVCIGTAFAQTHKVSGTVTEAANGAPVPGATVMVEGTMTGTSTGVDGKFTINVPARGSIVVSAIGFTTVTIPVEGRNIIDVALEEDRNVLENAVVVGYGSAKKVGSLVGSVSTVNSETIKNAPSSSALDQLQGQVAGLSVLTTGGVAGDNNVSMTLHGVGSLGASSTPLFIIDGIPSSSRSIMAMNPNDIKAISILKDASATSIYGARAANGVVFVTTKSGSYNEKATVTVRSQYGISTLADMTFYNNMMSGDELKEFWVRAGIYTPEYIYNTYTSKGYTSNTKWYEYFQNLNNPQYQNDITVEGGSQKIAYMVGGSQFHQRGTAPGNFYDRYTVRSNVQGHPKDWLKVGANVSLSLDKRQQNPNWGDSGNMSNYTSGGLSYLQNPLYYAIDPKTGKEMSPRYSNNAMNPKYYMENNPDQYDRYGLLGSLFVEIEPIRNLKIASRAGIDGAITLDNWKRKPTFISNPGNGLKGKYTALDYSGTITNTVEYSFDLGEDHKFTILGGQEGIANYYDYYSASSTGQTDDRLLNLQNGKQSTYSISESHTESKFLSFFAHADYTLFDRYIFDATVRNDACSRFGIDRRNATFWSAGFLWKLKKEAFVKDVNWINDLNFKLSYGTQGNAGIGDYSSLALIGAGTSYAEANSKVISQPENPELTWEQQALLTVALSGRLFDKLDFDFEYYNRQTTDMLMDVPYPYTTGFSSLTANVGGLLNRGFDIELGFDIIRTRDAFLRAKTTFNWNQEKITELFDGRDRWEIANTGITYVVGQPVAFYYPIFAGIDPEDGAPTWYQRGDDMTVTTKDKSRITKTFDEASLTQNTGNKRNAPINGGFGFSGAWKGLSFLCDFSYVLGKSLISNDGYFYGNPANFAGFNAIKSVNDFWTPTHTDAKWPDWSKGYIMRFDTHLLQDASFLRLKNLQIGYSLPKSILGWTNGTVEGIKFTFTGRNLLTFTKYDGIDPEVDSNLTYGIGGNTKQFLGGIEITF